MTTSRSTTSETDSAAGSVGDGPADETPDLNVYEIHSERTVLTEPENTDGWIATDMTVSLPD